MEQQCHWENFQEGLHLREGLPLIAAAASGASSS
jgi:hypothetical protein